MSGMPITILESVTKGRIFGLDFQIPADTLILAIAVFVLFILLSYLLFNPAREFLKKRQQFVASQLDEAARDKEQANAYKKEYDQKLKVVDKEAEEILSNARKKALKQESSIINEAKEEAQVIKNRAYKDIELEKSKVRNDMKQEMIDVASAMASKFVAASLDDSKQQQLIDDALNEMGDGTWQN